MRKDGWEERREALKKTAEELKVVEASTVESMWTADLKNLEGALKKV